MTLPSTAGDRSPVSRCRRRRHQRRRCHCGTGRAEAAEAAAAASLGSGSLRRWWHCCRCCRCRCPCEGADPAWRSSWCPRLSSLSFAYFAVGFCTEPACCTAWCTACCTGSACCRRRHWTDSDWRGCWTPPTIARPRPSPPASSCRPRRGTSSCAASPNRPACPCGTLGACKPRRSSPC